MNSFCLYLFYINFINLENKIQLKEFDKENHLKNMSLGVVNCLIWTLKLFYLF